MEGELVEDGGLGGGGEKASMAQEGLNAAMVQERLMSAGKMMESFVKRAVDDATWPPSEEYSHDIILPMATAIAAILGVLLISGLVGGRKKKLRGVDVQVAGPGVAKRNVRFLGFVETPWQGGTTLASIFETCAIKHANLPCLGTRKVLKKEAEVNQQSGKTFEKLTLGDYSFITYGEALDLVKVLASGLVSIGHGSGERLAIFAETRQEWQLTFQACCRMSVTVVTVYASLGEEALVHALNETECTTVVCDTKQFEKLVKVGKRLKDVRRVVHVEEDENTEKSCAAEKAFMDWDFYSFSKLKDIGRQNPTETQLPQPGDIVVIMYTSGSTGMPKGVMVTHSNLVSVAAAVSYVVPDLSEKDIYLSFLPLAHIFALVGELTMFTQGSPVGYGSPLTLSDTSSKIKKGTRGDLTALRPTVMIAVPTVLDRIRDAVWKQVDKQGCFVKALFRFAYNRCNLGMDGKWWGAHGLERWFWSCLVFRNLRKALGGHMRGMICGGAPLSPDTQRFMNICFGFPVVQGYGLTETCGGSCLMDFDDHSTGRVGVPMSCCFVKLVDWEAGNYRTTDKPNPRGEICIGGPSVTLGYINNPQKTEEVYKVDEDGIQWFYSGDIGQWTDDGCLEVIDRKKDIVKLQMGEYVSLAKVEVALGKSDFIDNVMVHADPLHSYVIALVVPNLNRVKEWANANAKEVDASSPEALCNSDEVNKQILKSIQQVAKEERLERFEVPLKIKLVAEPWTPENGMTTASLKLKREVIRLAFRADLEGMYSK